VEEETMALQRSRLRSELATASYAETKRLLAKIKTQHLVFQVGNYRVKASDCTNVLIDETQADDQIQFQRPGGAGVEYYDMSDIQIIKRLRNKKWLIHIKTNADPAQATP
jgi:hypothetical protein